MHLCRNPGNKTYAEAVRRVTAQSRVFSQTEKKRQRSEQEDGDATAKIKGRNDEQNGEQDGDTEYAKLIQEEAEEVRRKLGEERLATRGTEEQPLDKIMKSEEEQDLETELQEIYNSIFAKTRNEHTKERKYTNHH